MNPVLSLWASWQTSRLSLLFINGDMTEQPQMFLEKYLLHQKKFSKCSLYNVKCYLPLLKMCQKPQHLQWAEGHKALRTTARTSLGVQESRRGSPPSSGERGGLEGWAPGKSDEEPGPRALPASGACGWKDGGHPSPLPLPSCPHEPDLTVLASMAQGDGAAGRTDINKDRSPQQRQDFL